MIAAWYRRLTVGDPLAWLHIGGLAAVGALVACFYYVAVQPRAQALAEQHQLQAALEEAQERHTTASAQAARLEQQLERTQSVLDDAAPLRPVSQLNRRLADLGGLLQTHRVEMHELNPGEARPHEALQLVPLRLRASGEFPQLVEMLEQLHQQHPDTHVVGLTLQRERDSRATEIALDLSWAAASDTAHRAAHARTASAD